MSLLMNAASVDKLIYQGKVGLPRTQLGVGGWSSNETENELSILLITALRGQTSYRRYIDVECPDGTHVYYDKTGYCYNNDAPTYDEDWDEIYFNVPKQDGQYKLSAFVETSDGRSALVYNEWPTNITTPPLPELVNPVQRVFINGLLKAKVAEITQQPIGGTIDDNQTMLLEVVVNPLAGDITYQWWDDDYGEFNLIPGATGPSYEAGQYTSIGNRDSRSVYCRLYGFGGPTQFLDTTRAYVTVKIRPAVITTQPVGSTILDNQTKVLSVVADGLGDSLSYRWYVNGVDAPGTRTNSTYTFNPNGSTANVKIKCRVTRSGAPSVYTNEVTVTVNSSFNLQMVVGYADNLLYLGDVRGYVPMYTSSGSMSGKFPNGQAVDYLYAGNMWNAIFFASMNDTKWNNKTTVAVVLEDISTGAKLSFNMTWTDNVHYRYNSTTPFNWLSARIGRSIGVKVS